ncbi:hypothetical protein DQ04_02261000 [Trypanosoma grayi]|uniref:hypothetical protein n=1 Tax=Trypanosoma grayi TaxID=71804 RepID=UPI0004F4033D|nr:hypothetical protein DQ04_02261000 [Trypanosoma grayi]KEG11801.1 hypothetical protein DQ04_02261000 [Trypanosoma grayi]
MAASNIRLPLLVALLLLQQALLAQGFSSEDDDKSSWISASEPDQSMMMPTPTRTVSWTRNITPSFTLAPAVSRTLSPTLTDSPTATPQYSPTITPTISHTPSLEEFPDNMYTRADSCDLPTLSQCAEDFCNCITRGPPEGGKHSWRANNGMYTCDAPADTNCYYHLFCARERVACLWSAALGNKTFNTIPSFEKDLFPDEPDDGVCDGLEHIKSNFSGFTANMNYYDTMFYTECIDYATFILKRTGGDICTPITVPMFVCGPSLIPPPPARHIDYAPVQKGSRRLLISIAARIVGNFSAVFAAEEERGYGAKRVSSVVLLLREAMYACFLNAIGIDGEFTMTHVDDCLVINYGVGVGEADPWVGDTVTANALSLMVRNTSWMARAQKVVSTVPGSANLSAPIVVYDVSFEPGHGQPVEKMCDSSCVAGITVVSVLTFIVLLLAGVLCCRQPQRVQGIFEASFASIEEMDSFVDVGTIK